VLRLDRDNGVSRLNSYLQQLLAWPPDVPMPRRLSDLLTPAADLYVHSTIVPHLQLTGAVDEAYLTLRPTQGPDVPVLVNARLRPDGDGSDWIFVRVEQRSRWEGEVLKAKRLADERRLETEVTSRELEAATTQLASVLQELRESHWLLRKAAEVLPTCMYCHRVRGDENQWQSAMEFLRKNSTFLSHGCCPACYDQAMQDFGVDDDPTGENSSGSTEPL
jgi:hypothetical protein